MSSNEIRPRSERSGLLKEGDRVQLVDPKGRLHTITLADGAGFSSHKGVVRHDLIIGSEEGSVHRSEAGTEYLVQRPLLSDYVMSMPRGAAIVYPKDAAQIVALADVYPGAVVVEAGVGSGALSLWLLRALGADGHLFSFERREEFAAVARGNISGFYGKTPDQWTLKIGDLADTLGETIPDGGADRVILDMLAPWENLAVTSKALRPGGVFLAYVATVTQLSRVAEAIRDSGDFTEPQSSETLVRTWHVDGLAVRPDHRMVAHTGFLITARRLAPGTVLPVGKKRLSKTEFNDKDIEAWTPGAVGEREVSNKVLRKKARAAEAIADGARKSELNKPSSNG